MLNLDSIIYLIRILNTIQSMDVVLISDFDSLTKEKFIEHYMKSDENTPGLQIVNTKYYQRLENIFPISNCEANSYEDEKNRHEKYSKLFIFWLNDENLISSVDLLKRGLVFCSNKNFVGDLRSENTFVFFMENNTQIRDEIIYTKDWIRNHQRTFFAFQLNSNQIDINRFNLNVNEFRSVGKVFSKRSDLPLDYNFLDGPQINQRKLKVGYMPYAYNMIVDLHPDPKNKLSMSAYTNHSGKEIEILKALSEYFHSEYQINNPKSRSWGNNGLLGYTANGTFDFMLTDACTEFNLKFVKMSSITGDIPRLTFVAPYPRLKHNIWAVINPFSIPIWIGIFCSFIYVAFIIYVIANHFGNYFRNAESDNVEFRSIFYYLFRSFIAETLHEEEFQYFLSLAPKLIVGTWILSSFILTSAYMATQRSVLLTPKIEKSINTLEEVVNSELSWDMVIYGTEIQKALSRFNDPIIEKFLKEMNPAYYDPIGTDRFDRVMKRELISFEWTYDLESKLFMRFSTLSGKPLVHLSKESFLYKGIPALGFNKRFPDFRRFNLQIMRFFDMGLTDKWKFMALTHLKEKSGLQRAEEESDDKVRKMSLEDLSVIFVMLCIELSITLFTFFGEKLYAFKVKKKKIANIIVNSIEKDCEII